nr:protein Shroom-like [Ipomoea batatas]
MAMLRSLTTRKSPLAYEQLKDEAPLFEPKLSRTASASVFSSSSSKKVTMSEETKSQAKKADKASKIHPIFSLFDGRRKSKKVTSRPEFSRYVQYLKEGGFGGIMDMANKSNMSAK